MSSEIRKGQLLKPNDGGSNFLYVIGIADDKCRLYPIRCEDGNYSAPIITNLSTLPMKNRNELADNYVQAEENFDNKKITLHL
ncbi:MAG: hypothetical protein GTN76_15765 [Candidatus Aenigmarchaeota archaeon]|nr:hypothetical protein [Candidatus Aenigmarchaeota archaeon]